MNRYDVPTTATRARQVWEAVLGEVQLQVTRPCYETWFKNTSGVAYKEGELTVSAPSTFVAEMLESRMYNIICQAAERVAHEAVDIKFRVRGGADPNYAGSEAPVHVNGSTNHAANGAPSDTPPPSATNGHVAASPAAGANRAQGPGGSDGQRRLTSTYTFSTFVVGKSNELAHAAALAVAERPGHIYNPLFLYADVGLGKTHLLHAIGHALFAKGLQPVYSTTEEFTNEYIKAIREGRTEEFRARYRTADVLLLDDIQFLIGKEQTQEGFFHTFNALHMANRQVVVTSDRPVGALALLEDRVQSRLAGGLVADIQAPDLETRLAILRAKADSMRRVFSQDVLQFLAERIHRNIRELEGSLNRLTAYADLVDVDVTVEAAHKVVAESLNQAKRPRPTERSVVDAVSSYFRIDKDTLLGRRRDKQTALARQVAMYLLREEAQLGFSQIGRALGGKDHSTALHACQKIAQQSAVDAHLRQDLLNIRDSLRA